MTSRERQVCERLFQGQTRQEIATCLGIKPRTVREHLENIHSKLRVRNRIGVVLRIIQMRDELGVLNAKTDFPNVRGEIGHS